jgi:hypothetical protein
MALFKSYWTVDGISPDARDAAVRAADANGEELGEWLRRLIRKVSEAERETFAPANDTSENGAKIGTKNGAAISAADAAEEANEEKADEATPDTDEDAAEEPDDTVEKEEEADGGDDKLSSIERAMLQSRAAGDAGSR